MEDTKSTKECLIVVSDERTAGRVVQQIRIAGYEPAVMLSSEEALKLMAFINYDLVILEETMVRSDKRLLAYVLSIPMSLRRKSLFFLLSETYRTHDGLNAFALGLDAVISKDDLHRLAGCVQIIEKDHFQLYRVFQSIIG